MTEVVITPFVDAEKAHQLLFFSKTREK
jgi:hypothetical protein